MVDNKFNFHPHVDVICKKARQNFPGLSRIFPFKQLPKRRLLINEFFMESQFTYCPSVCMHHRNIGELPEKDNSVIIHKRALRFPAIKMFKVIKGISPLTGNGPFQGN